MQRETIERRRSVLGLMVLLAVTALVTSSCSLWRWGAGNPFTTSPTLLAGAGDDWLRASGGTNYDCAVGLDLTLWCWGDNAYGQLGVGSTTSQANPTQVGSDADWDRVSAGEAHTCATKQNGTLWCWGSNLAGALGDGTTTDRLTPTQVGTDTDWRDVTAAGTRISFPAFPPFPPVEDDTGFTCALKDGDTLWCWGDNRLGQLGDGTTTSRTVPTQVGTGGDWEQVSAGPTHACGIRATDQLVCWGSDEFGQLGALGIGTAPRVVAGSWRSVSAGGNAFFATPVEARGHTCAVATSGALECWGYNGSGQLGDGTTVNSSAPVVVGAATDWIDVSTGGIHTCGRRSGGTLWCWGGNSSGQVGDGTQATRLSPVQVGAATPWLAVDAGAFHTIAVDRIEPA